MKPTPFKIALIAAALNDKGASHERVDFAMDLWKCAEKALAPKRFSFSEPHPLEDFLKKLMPKLAKHDDRLPLYRQFVTEMNREHGYQEKSNFEEGPSLRLTHKMAEKQAAEEIGLQRQMGVSHANQIAGNFIKWNKSRTKKEYKSKGKKGAAARNSPEKIKKREEKKAAEAAALASRVRSKVISVVDFVNGRPSHADLSWEPLDANGISTNDGWKMNAVANGTLGFQLPQAIDLSGTTHLVFHLRRENGGDSDVQIKLICADGERLFKIKSAAIPLEMQEVLLPLEKGKGEGSVTSVKEIRIQGDFKKGHQFAYTLKSLEAEKIILVI